MENFPLVLIVLAPFIIGFMLGNAAQKGDGAADYKAGYADGIRDGARLALTEEKCPEMK